MYIFSYLFLYMKVNNILLYAFFALFFSIWLRLTSPALHTQECKGMSLYLLKNSWTSVFHWKGCVCLGPKWEAHKAQRTLPQAVLCSPPEAILTKHLPRSRVFRGFSTQYSGFFHELYSQIQLHNTAEYNYDIVCTHPQAI